MSRRPKNTPAAPAVPANRTQHRDVAEGRSPTLDLASAVAIEAASLATGFEPPPAAQAVIDAADPAELDAARQAVAEAKAIVPTETAEGGEPSQPPQE